MQSATLNSSAPSTFNVWRATMAGASASLIGLARFASTPLLPAIIGAHWFSESTAAYLGAANLGGYLAGALLAGPMTRRAAPANVLRAMMLAATVAFVACAFPVSFLWFFVVTGALLVTCAGLVHWGTRAPLIAHRRKVT